jgi:hypothetical protein
MKNNFLKQRHVPHLGAMYEVFVTALPLLSAINFISILVILYANVQPFVKEYLPWMTLPLFFIIVTILFILCSLLVYKLLLPSLWAFRGKQMFGFEGEIKAKLDEILVELKRRE